MNAPLCMLLACCMAASAAEMAADSLSRHTQGVSVSTIEDLSAESDPSCTPGITAATSQQRIRRFPKSEVANYTEYLPRLDELPSSLTPYVAHYRYTTREPPYSTLTCSPTQGFRAVYDGYEHLLTSGLSPEEIADEVEEIFYAKGFVPRNTPIQQGTLRQQTFHGGSPKSIRNREKPYEQMHVDYFEIDGYSVTALLYDEPSMDLEGGETCIADAFATATNGAGQEEVVLQQGMVIEPKKGRLLIFSAGGENLHGALPIQNNDQQRHTYIMFFKCKDQSQIRINVKMGGLCRKEVKNG